MKQHRGEQQEDERPGLAADVLIAVSALTSVGTALSLSRNPHWLFRLFDFPRVQIATGAFVSAALYRALYYRGTRLERTLLAASALTLGWQCFKIFPYTPLHPQQVAEVNEQELGDEFADATVTLLVSNVLMENDRHDLLVSAIQRHDPDVVLVVETDDSWAAALEPLTAHYPFVVRQPQNNYYGMMLFSRLPLVNVEVRFLVQNDVPSAHVTLTLRNGTEVRLHALHPRPPEPLRDQLSAPRDAELVLVGRTIGDEEDRPTIVAGDLNDVAWSATSELFLRLSGLLDPRIGRGFYNRYNAKNPLFRFPLDHVFHSNDFKLLSLQRLDSIGSDHFPILIKLVHMPEAEMEQPEPEQKPGDQADAEEKLSVQAEAAATGDDRPNDD